METFREQKVECKRTVSESRGEWHGRVVILNAGKLKWCFVAWQSMLDDPELAKHGLLPPGAPGSTAREASVIFKLASNLKPPVSFTF